MFRLIIYDNFPSAPGDGVYVAVDYDTRVGNVAHHCGYPMWHSFDAEEFKLGRIETGTASEDLLTSIAEDDVNAVLKQLRCANECEE